MKTVLTTSAGEAAEFIRKGGLAAFPTETVYGLGADVFNEAAIQKIFEAKGRPADNPLIVHIGTVEQIKLLAAAISSDAEKFIEVFFPGPLTIVLPKTAGVSLLVTAGLETVGIRMPLSSLAQEFLQECGAPVAAPSANLSGRPSPTTWQAVFEDLDGRIDCILKGDETEVGLESTVVDCTTEVPLVLRSGAVTLEQLREIVPATKLSENDPVGAARSPGLKHKHYSPRAKVVLVHNISAAVPDPANAYIGTDDETKIEGFGLAKICPSVTEYAHALFEFFRECDRRDIGIIYCQKVESCGLGTALMDRLSRAAQS